MCEISHLIASQPSSIEAVRLKCLLQPASKSKPREFLAKHEVSREYNREGWMLIGKSFVADAKKCITVEPLNKDTFGTSRFVLFTKVVLFQR